ncbi:hypothetical protein [Dyadobacter diqingensis]|uniref:hypothetical protein n=1 Tax=Dyadobacter diqingensis TaxID=2938121 RepID=UPI0020C3CB50|nr:hypothetical protein [Dyadobacter diqingensis]
MIYLFWSLLNLGMLVWFLLIVFSVLKLILKNLGMLSTVIFIVGILSFMRSAVINNQSQGSQLKMNEVVGTENLEKSLSYNLNLMYVYNRDSLTNAQLSGKVLKSGTVIGHEWAPGRTDTYLTNGVIHYDVSGDHQWKLLGLVLYNQPKRFQGTIKIK